MIKKHHFTSWPLSLSLFDQNDILDILDIFKHINKYQGMKGSKFYEVEKIVGKRTNPETSKWGVNDRYYLIWSQMETLSI